MKLRSDATIDPAKFTLYLLLPQSRSDKSRYLDRAGYSPQNVEVLIEDLRLQILPREATLSRATPFGEMYFIDGALTGPNGRRISLRTIWQKDPLSDRVHFVTLIPQPSPTA